MNYVMSLRDGRDLTKGKLYPVVRPYAGGIIIRDNSGDEHYLSPGEFRAVPYAFKSPSVRFADARVDRFGRRPSDRKFNRHVRRGVAKACAAEFKAVREDKRFALPALMTKVHAAGYSRDDVPVKMRGAFPSHEIDDHDAIPCDARRYAYAHPAKCDPAKIACYPTRADAARNREVVMSAGRFFAACYPSYSPRDVQAYAEAYANAQKPPVLHFADDAEAWCNVYASQRGFSSCMGGKWDRDSSTNPVRFYVYPKNGLRLAYLTHNGKPDGETVARSIINDKRKKYVRVYGDARLHGVLQSLGYDEDAEGALDGVKCAARTNRHGELIAPYVDGSNRRAQWDGERDYCTIADDGNFDIQNTDGTATGDCDDENMMTCDHCGDQAHEDEVYYSEHHEISICAHCSQRHYTSAIIDRCGNRDLIRDDCVITIGNETYLDDPEVLSKCGFILTYDSEWITEDSAVYLEYLGEYVDCDECTRLDVATPEGDNHALCDDTIEITLNGDTLRVHRDYDGDTDEKVAARRKVAASRFVRHYSRAPQRRRAARTIARRIAK
jgi:hypothetical protein